MQGEENRNRTTHWQSLKQDYAGDTDNAASASGASCPLGTSTRSSCAAEGAVDVCGTERFGESVFSSAAAALLGLALPVALGDAPPSPNDRFVFGNARRVLGRINPALARGDIVPDVPAQEVQQTQQKGSENKAARCNSSSGCD